MKTRYPKYKDSGVEWLSQVPKHWEVKRLKEITILMNGFPFDSKNFNSQDGTRVIRIRDITAPDKEITCFNGEIVEEALTHNDDVIIGMDGDFNICWWNHGTALLNQRLCCLRPNSAFDKRFLYYGLS